MPVPSPLPSNGAIHSCSRDDAGPEVIHGDSVLDSIQLILRLSLTQSLKNDGHFYGVRADDLAAQVPHGAGHPDAFFGLGIKFQTR